MSRTPVLRIIDASFNRAAEGLRVVEDYVRFVLDDPFLTGEIKLLRHDLAAAMAAVSSSDRHAARDAQRDVGTTISTVGEESRADAWDVCAASLKRTEQSLRSLGEYGKVISAEFAGGMESLRYRVYMLEKAIDVGRSSRERLAGVRLCVLVDGRRTADEFERLVKQLVEAGVGMIQLRDKELDDRDLAERARRLVALTGRQPPALPGVIGGDGHASAKLPAEPGAEARAMRQTLAVVNDRADIAAAVQADGVHLGQEDLSVKDVRAIVGTRMLVGASTHNLAQARAAVLDGANYLGAGPTFPSTTKAFDEFAGLEYLRDVSAEVRLPTFAIGGITTANVSEVLAAGIGRIAVGAAVVDAKDPGGAASELLGMLKSPSNACGLARSQAAMQTH